MIKHYNIPQPPILIRCGPPPPIYRSISDLACPNSDHSITCQCDIVNYRYLEQTRPIVYTSHVTCIIL
jgi:hypothetical protein